jgi:hypothetical protein
MRGHAYDHTLMIVGRAVNGGEHKWTGKEATSPRPDRRASWSWRRTGCGSSQALPGSEPAVARVTLSEAKGAYLEACPLRFAQSGPGMTPAHLKKTAPVAGERAHPQKTRVR